MANERHLYLTIQGSYIDAKMAGEVWQTGIRLGLVFGNVDDLGILPNNWDVVYSEHTDLAADYQAEGNFVITEPPNFLGGFNPVTYLGDQCRIALQQLTSSGVSNNVQVDRMVLVPVESPGRVIQTEAGPSKATLTYSTKPKGNGTAQMMPAEVSVALSLDTAAKGRRGNGRMFLPPMTTSTVSSGGRLTSATCQSIANYGKGICEALAYDSPTDGYKIRPIVTSRPFTRYGVVQRTRVGDVFDSQRRRRNELTEVYSTATPSY
jgi:hypothetical protein